MEKIKKDGKIIAVVGTENEAFWKNQIELVKQTIKGHEDGLKFWEMVLKGAEREFLKAQRNHND